MDQDELIVPGGDLAGQNVCRDAAEGFPILDTIRSRRPNVFVGLGDMVYADNGCEPTGRYGNAQLAGPGPATGASSSRISPPESSRKPPSR